jgi:hypothetical protein
VTPSARPATIEKVAADILVLVRQFEDDPVVSTMKEVQLVVRLLDEQFELVPTDDLDGTAESVKVKDPKQVSSSSLQNPQGHSPQK